MIFLFDRKFKVISNNTKDNLNINYNRKSVQKIQAKFGLNFLKEKKTSKKMQYQAKLFFSYTYIIYIYSVDYTLLNVCL